VTQQGKVHEYSTQVIWTGNEGTGTSAYRAYRRDHDISVPGKPLIAASSDPAFRGDPARYNPEEIFVASLSSCHMLWYLHLCADAGILVMSYVDEARGIMMETEDGGGRFTEVVLHPRVQVAAGSNIDVAARLHEHAHQKCFIANSVNFPVTCMPVVNEVGRISAA
jgi:organic hydroperoxide reductase OsmC/OhrA